MSKADLLEFAGTVTEVLPGGNTVWDYGYGRTITFDTRGRTTSLSGFPSP